MNTMTLSSMKQYKIQQRKQGYIVTSFMTMEGGDEHYMSVSFEKDGIIEIWEKEKFSNIYKMQEIKVLDYSDSDGKVDWDLVNLDGAI